jgi:CheY-like chemotaxis protein
MAPPLDSEPNETTNGPSSSGRRSGSSRRGALRPSDAPLRGLKIVVVDDDDDARDLMTTVLERRGASILTASSAADAYETFVRERPDVLVSDIAMPGEDGFMLMKRIRALAAEDGGTTACVAVTAYASAPDRRRALDAGFDGWLPKPVDHDALVAMILDLDRERRPSRRRA